MKTNRPKIMTARVTIFSICFLLILLISCEKVQGPDGKTSLLEIIEEPAGENCKFGGYKIIAGIDINGNEVLDANEIQTSEYICIGNYDRQIRFDFGFGSGGGYTRNTNWEFLEKAIIPGFDLNNYPGIDSVSFQGFIYSEKSHVTSTVELYNLTDNESIINSSISATSSSEIIHSTIINFLDGIPLKEIDIGIRYKSSIEGEKAYIRNPILILHR